MSRKFSGFLVFLAFVVLFGCPKSVDAVPVSHDRKMAPTFPFDEGWYHPTLESELSQPATMSVAQTLGTPDCRIFQRYIETPSILKTPQGRCEWIGELEFADLEFKVRSSIPLPLPKTQEERVAPSLSALLFQRIAAIQPSTWVHGSQQWRHVNRDTVGYLHAQTRRFAIPLTANWARLLTPRNLPVATKLANVFLGRSRKSKLVRPVGEFSNTMFVTFDAMDIEPTGNPPEASFLSVSEPGASADHYWQYYADCDHWKVDFEQTEWLVNLAKQEQAPSNDASVFKSVHSVLIRAFDFQPWLKAIQSKTNLDLNWINLDWPIRYFEIKLSK